MIEDDSPPLFIALRREHFEAFRAGRRRVVYCAWGTKWNSTTCTAGRAVVLTLGRLGKRHRLFARIVSVRRLKQAPANGGGQVSPTTPVAAIRLAIEAHAVVVVTTRRDRGEP